LPQARLRGAARMIRPLSGTLANWLLDSVLQQLVAVLLTPSALYTIGLFASLVPGK